MRTNLSCLKCQCQRSQKYIKTLSLNQNLLLSLFSLSEELLFPQLGFVNWNHSQLLYSLLEDQPFQDLGLRKTQTLLTLPIEPYFFNLLY